MADIIKRADGTYLVPLPGATNAHLDHYHVASDGTILSIKEGGVQQYNRREVRQKISAVTGMNFPPHYTVNE